MTANGIRQKFLEYMKSKGHAIVPSSSLIPDDPSVLLTTAGMQQFKKYYTGGPPIKDFSFSPPPPSKNLFELRILNPSATSAISLFLRCSATFFWRVFQKEAIAYGYEFITKVMGLEISYVTIFEGKDDIGVPKDVEGVKSTQHDEYQHEKEYDKHGLLQCGRVVRNYESKS